MNETTAPAPPAGAETTPPRENFLGILLIFLRLGLTSFGGPIAHIGYLREEFVARRRWMSESAYADLVALAQFMPGPASSQTGFAIGVLRGGLPGGLAAWLGFTLPSAIVMLLAAYGVDLAAGGTGAGVVHGLKLVAVAVVAQAVPGPLFTFAAFLGAAQNFWPNGGIGAAIALVMIFLPGLLLIYGMLPFWDGFRRRPIAQAMLRGVNAAVVGILLAALYDPIWTSSVRAPVDFAIALAAFGALVLWKLPAWLVVALTAAAGALGV